MADETLKKLIIKLDISTKEWQTAVKDIKSQLNAINKQAQSDAAKAKSVQKEQINLTKDQIELQKRLQSEAKTLQSVDQAKAAWEKKNQSALETKIKQRILETAELKKQTLIQTSAIKLEQDQLRLANQKLETKKKEDLLLTKQQKDAVAAAERIKKEQRDEEERLRRIVANQKVSGLVAAAGQTAIPQFSATQAIQQRELITTEKQRLTLMEAELRMQASQEGVKKEDLVLAQKELAEQRAKLGIQEVQLQRSERQLQIEREREQVIARTVDKTAVAKIQQHVGYSPYTAPKIGGLFGVGGIVGQSANAAMESVAKEKEKLNIMQAELRVLAQEENYRKIDVQEVTKIIAQERQRLSLLTLQLREQKAQSVMGRLTGLLGEASGSVTRTLHTLSGGGLIGDLIVGGIGIELFNKVIEKVGELKADLIGAVGPAQQLRVEFERLTIRRGSDSEDVLSKLRLETRGLVTDLDLYKTANTFLRSGMKLTDEQMLRLVGTTVELARATGHTAPEAMNALQRYFITGRAMSLGMVTGINRQALAVKGLASTLDPLQRRTIEFTNVLHQEEIMLGRVGKAATTVPELLTQITVAQQNFVEDIAKGITGSNNFNDAIAKISKRLIELGPKLSDIALKLGQDLGKAIQFVVDHFGELKLAVEVVIGFKLTVWAVQGALALQKLGAEVLALAAKYGILKVAEEEAAVEGVVAGASGVGGGLIGKSVGAVGTGVAAIGGGSVVGGIAVLTGVVSEILLFVKAWYDFSKQGKGDIPKAPTGLRKDTLATPGAAGSLYYDDYLFNDLLPKARGKALAPPAMAFEGGTKPGANVDEGQDENALLLAKKLAAQRLELNRLTNKIIFDELKHRIAAEEQALKDQYDEGLISLQNYINKEKSLKTEEFNATIKQLRDNKDAELKKAQVGNTITIGDQTFSVDNLEVQANVREKIIRLEHDKEIEEQTKYNSQVHGLDKQLQDDRIEAFRSYTDAINKVNKDGVAERINVLETEFKQGNIGASAYIEQRKELIQEEYELTIQGLNEKLQYAKKNSKEESSIQIELIQAAIDREKQYTKFVLSENDTRLKSLETHYDKAKKFLESQASIATGFGSVDGTQKQLAINQQLLSITDEYISKQQQMLINEREGSDNWIDIKEKIASAIVEQQKLNQSIAQAKDVAGPLAGFFGQIAGLLGEFRNTQGITALFKTIQSSLQDISKFSIAMKEGNLFKNVFGDFKSLFSTKPRSSVSVKRTAQQIFDESLQKSTSTMYGLSKGTYDAIAELRRFQAALKGASDTVSGKEGGDTSGTLNISKDILPSYQFGGIVSDTGPAFLHKGEEVITTGQVTLLGQFLDVIKQLRNTVESVINNVTKFGISVDNAANKLGKEAIKPPDPLSAVQTTDGKKDFDKTKDPSLTKNNPITDFLDSIKNMFKSGKSDNGDSGDNKDSDSFGAKLTDFLGGLDKIVSAITGLVKGITGGKNAAGGALSGGMAGLQFGSQFGPIGAAIGLTAGAGLGALFGNKEARLTADLKKVQDQMQSIVDSMNLGTISLGQSIADLRREREQALKLLSNDKKGSKSKKGQPSQVQQAIAAIDAEIAKLVDMQRQILSNLHESLVTLTQPLQFQEYLTSLDQIIKKYQEFASAASGNAQEVAAANQFLNLSLQNYVQTLNQQLNQAQQQAIQDALTLINLEYQRQQLINQEAQQEYDILTRGVLTRQRTTAMTKGQEIGQLRYQRDMQLEQMDEEIALQKHKVEAETKIFGLATTRIGLENQLLQAQKEQADYQIAQVLALSQIVSSLTSGLASGDIMQQISALYANGQMPTGTGLLMLLAQLLGLDVPSSVGDGQYGKDNWLTKIPQQFQSAANYVAGLDPSFVNDIQKAMAQPPGSQSRNIAVNDAQQYEAQGKTEGFDMDGLINWITTAPGFKFGGPIKQTGLIFAHEGEHVLTEPTVKKLDSFGGVDNVIQSITGMTGRLTNAFSRIGNTVTGRNLIPHDTPSKQMQVNVKTIGNSNTLKDMTSIEALKSHSMIFDLAQKRTSMEMGVINARQMQMKMEMAHLSALSDMLDRIQNSQVFGGSSSLEGMLQKTYETRGRYGSANFRRETL